MFGVLPSTGQFSFFCFCTSLFLFPCPKLRRFYSSCPYPTSSCASGTLPPEIGQPVLPDFCLYSQATLQYKPLIFSYIKTAPAFPFISQTTSLTLFLFHLNFIEGICYFSLILIFWFQPKPYLKNYLIILNQWSTLTFL